MPQCAGTSRVARNFQFPGAYDHTRQRHTSNFVSAQLQETAKSLCSRLTNLYQKPIKNQARTHQATECFNPEVLQPPHMFPHGEIRECIPEIPHTELEQCIVLPGPTPKTSFTVFSLCRVLGARLGGLGVEFVVLLQLQNSHVAPT
uniref:Uncharacterized protein n=1 Tax=Eutreptiella gymnastica TaxID=73025 RepID=A0A7S4CPM2_9EUGL